MRQQLLQCGIMEVVPHDVTLDYSYWSTDHILKVCACLQKVAAVFTIPGTHGCNTAMLACSPCCLG